jgi:RNA polymerase sigma-70 factor (ECF subfamily)
VNQDQDLCNALAHDLDQHFEQLVIRYQDRLYAFALRLTNVPQDAEEIAQDAFIRAYKSLATFTAERWQTLALRAWLYQIALNVFRNRVRGKVLDTLSIDEEQADDVTIEPSDDETLRPEPSAERAEQNAAIAAQIASLPRRYREAVVLRYVEELDYAEIAEVMKQPLGTVKSNVHRGIQMLRTQLAVR